MTLILRGSSPTSNVIWLTRGSLRRPPLGLTSGVRCPRSLEKALRRLTRLDWRQRMLTGRLFRQILGRIERRDRLPICSRAPHAG
jgi:hypothetical protein